MLSTLLQHGALPEDAVAFLWQLTEGRLGGAEHSHAAVVANYCCTRCCSLPVDFWSQLTGMSTREHTFHRRKCQHLRAAPPVRSRTHSLLANLTVNLTSASLPPAPLLQTPALSKW